MSVKLTGRVRLKRGLFGDMIVQVEESFLHSYCIGGYVETDHVLRWRNLAAEDLTTLNLSARSTDDQKISTVRLMHRLFGGYRLEGLFRYLGDLENWEWICAEDLLMVQVSTAV